MFRVKFTIKPFPWLMRQVNRGVSWCRYPLPLPTDKRTERSTGNDGVLSIVPDRNFSVRIKDGGPWPSLNFKLKNTIGYIALLENSLRARARELFPFAVCFTPKIRFSNILRPTCIGFRALNIWSTIIITREVLNCRRMQLRPHYCNCFKVTIALYRGVLTGF